MDELLDKRAVCRFFGGTERPIDQSTLWRGIKTGRFPKPIRIGPQVRRWSRQDCEAALRALMGCKLEEVGR
jgi:predicted DNA-binding transcriptional regulator AlpA